MPFSPFLLSNISSPFPITSWCISSLVAALCEYCCFSMVFYVYLLLLFTQRCNTVFSCSNKMELNDWTGITEERDNIVHQEPMTLLRWRWKNNNILHIYRAIYFSIIFMWIFINSCVTLQICVWRNKKYIQHLWRSLPRECFYYIFLFCLRRSISADRRSFYYNAMCDRIMHDPAHLHCVVAWL